MNFPRQRNNSENGAGRHTTSLLHYIPNDDECSIVVDVDVTKTRIQPTKCTDGHGQANERARCYQHDSSIVNDDNRMMLDTTFGSNGCINTKIDMNQMLNVFRSSSDFTTSLVANVLQQEADIVQSRACRLDWMKDDRISNQNQITSRNRCLEQNQLENDSDPSHILTNTVLDQNKMSKKRSINQQQCITEGTDEQKIERKSLLTQAKRMRTMAFLLLQLEETHAKLIVELQNVTNANQTV